MATCQGMWNLCPKSLPVLLPQDWLFWLYFRLHLSLSSTSGTFCRGRKEIKSLVPDLFLWGGSVITAQSQAKCGSFTACVPFHDGNLHLLWARYMSRVQGGLTGTINHHNFVYCGHISVWSLLFWLQSCGSIFLVLYVSLLCGTIVSPPTARLGSP